MQWGVAYKSSFFVQKWAIFGSILGSLWSLISKNWWWAYYFPLYTVHRVGRTGRAGNEGFAFTFITKEQVMMKMFMETRMSIAGI